MADNEDALGHLGIALYGRDVRPCEWIGGSKAKILQDAADRIASLTHERDNLQTELSQIRPETSEDRETAAQLAVTLMALTHERELPDDTLNWTKEELEACYHNVAGELAERMIEIGNLKADLTRWQGYDAEKMRLLGIAEDEIIALKAKVEWVPLTPMTEWEARSQLGHWVNEPPEPVPAKGSHYHRNAKGLYRFDYVEWPRSEDQSPMRGAYWLGIGYTHFRRLAPPAPDR
jgi:hypothetical protein